MSNHSENWGKHFYVLVISCWRVPFIFIFYNVHVAVYIYSHLYGQ